MSGVAPGHRPLSDLDYRRFRELVRTRIGPDFPVSRRPELERAVSHALADFELPDTERLLRLLSDPVEGPPALERWTPSLTINETHFFRNRPQIEALQRDILPGIIDRRRETRRLRIWSAACSTGEEAYTLAILLDMLLPDLDGWQIHLLATDIDRTALAKARAGTYGAWSFREVPDHVQRTYFTRRGSSFDLSERIRRMVDFRAMNLIDDRYPSALSNTHDMDLVLCRNVLIYFDEPTIRGVVRRFHEAVVPGGWLVVGHAEPSQEIFHRFQTRNFPGTVVYRRRTPDEPAGRAPIDLSTLGAGLTPAGPAPRRTAAPAARPASRPTAARPAVPLRRAPQPAEATPSAAVPGPEDALAAATALAAGGRSSEALQRLEDAAAAAPGDPRPAYELAKLHSGHQRLDEAERWVDAALERSSLLAPAHHLRGLILQDREDLDAALESQRRAVYADPDFALGHLALADLFARLGQSRRAVKALDSVERLLAGLDPEEPLPEGDGLTVERVRDLVSAQRQLVS